MIDARTASADIDLAALRANVTAIAVHVAPAAVMVVVKADGYGHGMLACAAAAREAGVAWLGAATPGEALALRAAGDTGRILCWLYGPADDLAPVVAADVDITVSSAEALQRVVAGSAGQRIRVHLKTDTGLSRNGAPGYAWAALCAAASDAERDGLVEVVGVWSHLAAADEPGAESVQHQIDAFVAGLLVAADAGLRPTLRHLANSAGALIVPAARYDLVRVGIAAYGIDPDVGVAALAGVELRPVMRLRAQLAAVKTIPAGAGVSYGHTWHAPAETKVGLVPLGYADGIPRHASNVAEVQVGDGRAPIRGRVCMDQFVVELGIHSSAAAGDEVTLFGPGDGGEPTAQDWARWCGTIGYEIVTRIGPRVPRRCVDRAGVDHDGVDHDGARP